MAITDLAGNALAPGTTAQVLGYIEVTAEEVLNLRMYDFLIKPIRDADFNDGNLFLKRYLEGWQDAWETTQGKVFAIKDLWSVTDCPDDFLPYLKNIVGWTKELVTKRVTDGLDAATLRRLISVSVPLWKQRGPEDTIVSILGVLTGQRSRVWSWFDLRWILDETGLGEDHQGRDPWILDLPSEGDDEHRFNVRIVDPGGLDRELVRNVARLMRPLGERIEISYLLFLDRFLTEGDLYQWDTTPTANRFVADGTLQLTNTGITQHIAAGVDGSEDWASYGYYARIKSSNAGGDFGISFYVVDLSGGDFYYVWFDVGPNVLRLRKAVGGAHSNIASYAYPLPFLADHYYGVRVDVVPEGSTNRIRVYVDGELRIEATDAAHTKGTIGVFHNTGSDLIVDECEVFPVPMDTDTIDINDV